MESRIDRGFHNDGLPCSRIDENTTIRKRSRKAYGIAAMPGLQAVRAAGTTPASPVNKDLE